MSRGFSAKRLDALRRDFDAQMDRALAEARLPRMAAWFDRGSSSDPFETNIANWTAEDGKRVLVVREADADETLRVDWFFTRTGLDDEIDMLQIGLREAAEHVPILVECYRRWLIEREPEARVDAVLEAYSATISSA